MRSFLTYTVVLVVMVLFMAYYYGYFLLFGRFPVDN